MRAWVELDDAVGGEDGAGAVGYEQHRATLREAVQGGQDRGFAGEIHLGGGLVQNQDRSVPQRGPGDRQPLRLAAGQQPAVFADLRRQAVRHRLDLRAQAGQLQRLPEAGVGGVRECDAQVVGDAAEEEEGALLDHGDPLAGARRIGHHVVPVQPH